MNLGIRGDHLAAEGRRGAQAAHASPWMHGLARGGLAARGAVFILVSLLAIRLAAGAQGQKADQKGALQQVAAEPAGRIVLLVLAVGFAGYAAWRLVVAVTGEPGTAGGGDTAKAARRLGAVAQALVYVGLLASTVALLSGGGASSSSTEHPAGPTARLMGAPGGRALVLVAGLVVVGAGVGLGVWAARGTFAKRLDPVRLRGRERTAATWLGRVGHMSRGAVVILVGVFLIAAAAHRDPGQARGLDDTLRTLQQQAYGTLLLAAAALGLFIFGLYSLVEARYRQV